MPLSKICTRLTCWDMLVSLVAGYPQPVVRRLPSVVVGDFGRGSYCVGAAFASAFVVFPALRSEGQKWFVTLSGDAPAVGPVRAAHQLARHASVVLQRWST